MSDSDTEMPSYPETPPTITQTHPVSPKTPPAPINDTPSPTSRIGKPLKKRPGRARPQRQRAASSSSHSLGGRFATPPRHTSHQVSQSVTPSRIQRRRPAVSGHQRAESFEHYLSSTRRLTRRNPSNDDIAMLGFANGLLPFSGESMAPTPGSLLEESPPLRRRQTVERLEQRVEDLQIAPQGEAGGSRNSNSHPSSLASRSVLSSSQVNPWYPRREDLDDTPVISLAGGSDS
ncbi:uncharacterized protein BKA55DRAFT_695701 [Fusarium redolens]|uniref:Uncharacterized protein n=1 Tax=Fusarium redolens TaxID=48865 RepID=A0A9P9G590_FUSRE|nr:uncharacterized protein BKA55DRAFT_695701 [Fusarium redolens]KAH7232280.1 hypothetical protein BKA55DRAFT_695701 [Fusarium redolens]